MPEDTDRKASGFWTAVNTEIKKAVEEGWSAFKESARIGKLRYRIHTLHKKAERHFTEMGGMVYDMAKPPLENPFSRPEVMKIIDEIRKIESETSALEEEIERLKRERPC